jgi:hypothetical protein
LSGVRNRIAHRSVFAYWPNDVAMDANIGQRAPGVVMAWNPHFFGTVETNVFARECWMHQPKAPDLAYTCIKPRYIVAGNPRDAFIAKLGAVLAILKKIALFHPRHFGTPGGRRFRGAE